MLQNITKNCVENFASDPNGRLECVSRGHFIRKTLFESQRSITVTCFMRRPITLRCSVIGLVNQIYHATLSYRLQGFPWGKR